MTTAILPRPDRSDQVRNFSKSAGSDELDIGWNEGVLSDGRPFVVECWALDQLTMLTYFFPAPGLDLDDEGWQALLEREGLIEVLIDHPHVRALPFTDAAGHPCWSVNVLVGADGDVHVSDKLPLRPYRRP